MFSAVPNQRAFMACSLIFALICVDFVFAENEFLLLNCGP